MLSVDQFIFRAFFLLHKIPIIQSDQMLCYKFGHSLIQIGNSSHEADDATILSLPNLIIMIKGKSVDFTEEGQVSLQGLMVHDFWGLRVRKVRWWKRHLSYQRNHSSMRRAGIDKAHIQPIYANH